jgi:predicted XRE-type DNA-binding protein
MRLVNKSSGNVFHDLGLPEAPELLAKAQLVSRIARILEQKNLTQVQAAERLGIDQPKVSLLLRGRFEGYSLERLMRFLNALDQDVRIVVRPTRGQEGSRGSIRVVA